MPPSAPRSPRAASRPVALADSPSASAGAPASSRAQFLAPITAPDFRAPWAPDERGEVVNAERAKIREKAGEAIWQAIRRNAPLQAAADAAGLAAALEFAEPKLHAGFLSLCAAREREGMAFSRAEALEDLLYLLGAPPLSFFGAPLSPGEPVAFDWEADAAAAPLGAAAGEDDRLGVPLGPFLGWSSEPRDADGALFGARTHGQKKWPPASRAGHAGRKSAAKGSPREGVTMLDLPDVALLGALPQSLNAHLTQGTRARPPSEESIAPLKGVFGAGLLDFSLGPLLPVFCSLLLLSPNGPWASLFKSAHAEEDRRALAVAWIWLKLRLTSAAANLSAPERRLDAACSMSSFLRGEEAGLGFSPELLASAEIHYFCVRAWLHFEACEAADPGASPGKWQDALSAQPAASQKAAAIWEQIALREGQAQWSQFLLDRFDGTLGSARFAAMSWAGASDFMAPLPTARFSWADALAQKPNAQAPDEAAMAYRRALQDPPPRNLLATLAECRRHANAPMGGSRRDARFEENWDAALNREQPFSLFRLTRRWASRRLVDPSLAPGSTLAIRPVHWLPAENLFDAWLEAAQKWRPDEQPLVDGFNPRAAQEAFLSALWMGPSWVEALLARAPFLLASLARRERPFFLDEFSLWVQTPRGEPEASFCSPILSSAARLAIFPAEAAVLFGCEPVARALLDAGARPAASAPFVDLVEWAQASGPQGLGVLRWAQSAHARFEAFELGGNAGGRRSGSPAGEHRGAKRL